MIFIALNSSDTTYKPEKIESGSSENQQQQKHSQMLNKKGVLGNCAISTGKHLCQSLFLIK